MAFPQSVADKAFAACGRRCCICHKFCGQKMELHHIHQRADGGEDTYENCIPLCFDCHADMGKGDPRHPKGKRYSAQELCMHRDNWYAAVERMQAPYLASPYDTEHYHNLRKQASKLLTLYADCLHNPIDLARTQDHRLPPHYDAASMALREFASELRSVAETMDDHYPITATQLGEVASYFIGLSNSMTVPYNQGYSQATVRHSQEYERKIRSILGLPIR